MMPAKRRRSKRRTDRLAEAEAWWTAFWAGCDFEGDLEPFGIRADKRRPSQTPHDEFMAAARDAWSRFGEDFMHEWEADGSVGKPWAFEQFGAPGETQCR